MAIGEHKGLVALGAACLFALGLVAGGLWGGKLFSPASPPSDAPIPLLLQETHLLLDQGQLDRAEKNYRSILSRDSANPEALTHIGNIAARRGDVEQALRYYDEALRYDPSYLHALWDKGLALRDMGNDRGAIEAWETFVRLVPPDSQDTATLKQWIAEAQIRIGAAAIAPPK